MRHPLIDWRLALQLFLLQNPQLELEKTSVNGMPYIRLSGTSMATAVTTGVIAQMMQAHTESTNWKGRLKPNAIKALLQYSALTLSDTDVLTQGAGALNGDGAVALASRIDSTAPLDHWWLTQGVTENSVISGESLQWSQRFIWGDRLVWGNEIYWNREAWDQRTIWGDRLVWGDRLIWGNNDVDSVVWGDRPIWGNRLVWGDRLIWGNLDDGTAGTMGVR